MHIKLKQYTDQVLYIGLDIHKSFTVAHVLDQFGNKALTTTIRGHWENIFAFLLGLPGELHVCYEATNGYGYLYDNIAQIAKSVQVAHPGHCRLIFRSKRKNDRIDAEKLAKLLYLNEVPAIYVPDINTRDWRRLITFRQKLVGECVRAKNRIRGLIRRNGIKAVTNLWSKKGLKWLDSVNLESPMSNIELTMLLDSIANLQDKIYQTEIALKGIADKHPGVSLLMTIPGIGIRTAEALVAWIDNPSRFKRNKSIGAYFGLIPSQDSSGGKERFGHITRQGPSIIRKLLCEVTWRALRLSPQINAFFEKVKKNDKERKKIALVATAHYLARVALAMLKTNKAWAHSQPSAKAA